VKRVLELTSGGVDHSFECVGLTATTEQAFGMLKRGGACTVVGMIPVGQMVELPGPAFLGEKKIQGSAMGSNHFPVDMPRLVDMYMSGKLKLDDMISRRVKLAEVNDAFAEMKRGEIARSVIVFDS
jgi:S-(hydroxymethyl)glutathione dehydrogenase/alcohol dehydrogenase